MTPRALRVCVWLCLCAWPPAVAAPPAAGPGSPFNTTGWKPIFVGVEHAVLSADGPARLRGHALRIDLRAEGLEFLATPDNGDRPGETDSLRTSTFLTNQKLQAAINAAPFKPVQLVEGQPQEVIGLLVSAGKVVSPHQAPWPALVITKENTAVISTEPDKVEGAWNAVSGFALVLSQGRNLGQADQRHPRTAVGVSADGRYLYWLVIDGRQPGHSEGATTGEVAAWLAELGAADGLNLDGGGTTTLVLAGPDSKPVIVNRPIHLGLPGVERPAGCHLGLRAKSLP